MKTHDNLEIMSVRELITIYVHSNSQKEQTMVGSILDKKEIWNSSR